jgi:hypothetical protein
MSAIPECLRMEAFHLTWATIDEFLMGINLKQFDQVLHWTQESFSAIVKPRHTEIQQPYPLLTDVICTRIPTTFVLTKKAELWTTTQHFKISQSISSPMDVTGLSFEQLNCRRKKWSRWLLQDSIEIAAIRCSRCS